MRRSKRGISVLVIALSGVFSTIFLIAATCQFDEYMNSTPSIS